MNGIGKILQELRDDPILTISTVGLIIIGCIASFFVAPANWSGLSKVGIGAAGGFLGAMYVVANHMLLVVEKDENESERTTAETDESH